MTVKMMILLTGATGFVGRAVLDRLLADKQYVVRASLRQPVAEASLPPAVESVYVGDLNKGTDWQDVMIAVDVVVHVAARVHIMHDSDANHLDQFHRVNVEGTLNLARQAAQAGVRRFIFISSIKVNGEQTLPDVSFTEEDAPSPVDTYGISKYNAEKGLTSIARQTGMELVIIRSPLVYGPGVKGNFRVMMDWIRRGIPLPLGAIRNGRSLVSIDNLVDFIITCIKHPEAVNQVFLVSDGEDLSTTELCKRVGKAMNRPARLFPVPPILLNIAAMLLGKRAVAQRLLGSLRVDITKAREMLGWTPPLSIDEALRRCVRKNE